MTKQILIEESYDSFTIVIDGKRFYFEQEDDKTKLVDVFKELGFKAEYEESC